MSWMLAMSQVLFAAFSNPYHKPRHYYYSTIHMKIDAWRGEECSQGHLVNS